MRRTDPHDNAPASRAAELLDRAAPLLFVLLWSSSFLGTRVGLRHMSPLWFVALRMILAAAIMATVVTASRDKWSLTPTQWLHSAVAGVTTQAILLLPIVTSSFCIVKMGIGIIPVIL